MSRPVHGGNLAWAASLAGCSPVSILDFSASISPLGPPESAIAAIQGHLGALTAYPDPNYGSLRKALGQWHGVSPDWVLPGNGVAELLTWVGRELAQCSRTYVLTPAFGDYLRALKAFEAQVVGYSLPLETSASLDSWVQLQALGDGAAGVLVNNPHNPTGQLFGQEQLLPLLERFGLVVVDEAFMDFVPPTEQQSVMGWVERFPNLVVLRSLTKFYSLPGLRLGYTIAHPERLQRWQGWRDPWSVNTLAAAAAEAVIQDTEFQQQTWDWLGGARSQLFEGLSQLPGLEPLPGVANFLLVRSQVSCVALQRALLEQFQILIRDCLSFAELGDRYFRVAVRTEAENQRLLEGLATVLRAMI